MYNLTSNRKYMLRVDLEDFEWKTQVSLCTRPSLLVQKLTGINCMFQGSPMEEQVGHSHLSVVCNALLST